MFCAPDCFVRRSLRISAVCLSKGSCRSLRLTVVPLGTQFLLRKPLLQMTTLSVNLGSSCVQAGGRYGQSLAVPHRRPRTHTVQVPLQSLRRLTEGARLSWAVHLVINQQVIYPREQNQQVIRPQSRISLCCSEPIHPPLPSDWMAAPPERQLHASLALVFLPPTVTQWDSVVLSTTHPGSVISSTAFYFGIFCRGLSCHVVQVNLLYSSSGFACGPYNCVWLPQGT